jgi:F-type H+-transporting ATPase subunit b
MIDIDITMPIQIANILIMIVVMNMVLYKPIRTILIDRQKKLGELNVEVETFNKNSKLRLEEFETKLGNARRQAQEKAESIRSKVQNESAEKIAGIRKEVDSAKSEQISLIEVQFAKAQQQLEGQIDVFANDMASKALGRTI